MPSSPNASREARLAALEKERKLYLEQHRSKSAISASSTLQPHENAKNNASPSTSLLAASTNLPIATNPFKPTYTIESARERDRRVQDEHASRILMEKRHREEQELHRLREEKENHERATMRDEEREKMIAKEESIRTQFQHNATKQREKALMKGVQNARALAKGPTIDAWEKLLDNEKKARSKYYETPRSLLLMLEEERTKNLQLNSDYQSLTSELDVTKKAYECKLQEIQQQRENDIRTLQKTLLEKSEECTALTKKLGQATTKHADDVIIWSSRTEKIDNQATRIRASLQEAESRILKQEKAILELTTRKKIMQEKINQRELELKKYIHFFKEKDGDWMEEKEVRMRLEVKTLELEHIISQREESITTQRSQIYKQQIDLEKLVKLRAQIDQMRHEINLLSTSESKYREELEKSEARELKANAEIEAMTLHHRKLINEIELLNTRTNDKDNEIVELVRSENKLRIEFSDVSHCLQEAKDDILTLSKRDRKQLNDQTSLTKEYTKLQEQITDTTIKLKETRNELSDIHHRLEQMTCDRDTQSQERQRLQTIVHEQMTDLRKEKNRITDLETELETLKRQTADLHATSKERSQHLRAKSDDLSRLDYELTEHRRRIAELTSSLEIEHRIKDTMKGKYTETINALNNKVDALNLLLSETQHTLQKVQATETHLRDMLQQKERQADTLNDKLSKVTASLGGELYTHQTLTTLNKDKIDSLQEQLLQTRKTLEEEITNLRNTVQQKTRQITTLNEQLSQLSQTHSQLIADRHKLESQLIELQSQNTKYGNTIEQLTTSQVKRDHEFNLLNIRYNNALQTVARLEDDIKDLHKLGSYSNLNISPIKHSTVINEPLIMRHADTSESLIHGSTHRHYYRNYDDGGHRSNIIHNLDMTGGNISTSTIDPIEEGYDYGVGDVSKLTSNVTGLTKRLKEQVEALGIISKTNSDDTLDRNYHHYNHNLYPNTIVYQGSTEQNEPQSSRQAMSQRNTTTVLNDHSSHLHQLQQPQHNLNMESEDALIATEQNTTTQPLSTSSKHKLIVSDLMGQGEFLSLPHEWQRSDIDKGKTNRPGQ